jgi:uncharacterized RDD family membrane protein YckC
MGTQGDVLGQRIVAFIIDGIVGTLASAILLIPFVMGVAAAGLGEEFASMAGVVTAPVIFLYFIVLEGMYGQTLGKKVMNLVVVKEDGSECGWDGSLIRNILRVVDALPTLYIVGLLAILLTDNSQRVGDLAASTLVVETE